MADLHVLIEFGCISHPKQVAVRSMSQKVISILRLERPDLGGLNYSSELARSCRQKVSAACFLSATTRYKTEQW